MARPERFELPTNWFEASYSIQLSYGRVEGGFYRILPLAVKSLLPASAHYDSGVGSVTQLSGMLDWPIELVS